MLEQETASIMKFIIENAENPYPYYWNVPQNFMIPAVYFPTPEMITGGETFLTYYIDSSWYINFFHKTAQHAYALAQKVLIAIKQQRNLIPLITEDGSIIENNWVRVEDPSIEVIENGTAQLTLNWKSRRPYKQMEISKTQKFHIDVFLQTKKEVKKNGRFEQNK